MHKGQEKRATEVDIREATVVRIIRPKITFIIIFESVTGGWVW